MGEDQPGMESMMEAIAERVQRGTSITNADARTILDSHDLIGIGVMADDARRRLHGSRTTFVRVFEVHVDAPPPALPEKMSAGEIRIVGRPGSRAAAVNAVEVVARLAGAVPLSGFSLADLKTLAGAALEDTCAALAQAGLQMIAGV